MHPQTVPPSRLFTLYNKAKAATNPPTILDPPTAFNEPPLGAALVAVAAAEDTPDDTAPAPLVVAAVAAEEALLKVLARDSEDSDLLEMNSEITDVAEEMAEDTLDETTAESAVVEEASQGISEGTTMPADLQMLLAKAMAAAWSEGEHSAWRQL